MKVREDDKIKNNMQARDIEFALKDVRSMKGKLEVEDRRKELNDIDKQREQVRDEIRKLNEQERYTKENEKQDLNYKVEESPYLNRTKTKVNKDYAVGYKKASLAFRMEDLFKQKHEIEEKLKEQRSQSRGRNTQLQQYDYLTIDPKLLNRSGSEVDETSINATKDKIKRLINERNKTLELYHSSIPVGGLDDDHVKDFEPKFYENVKHYTNSIEKSQNMTTKQKLNNLDYVRTKLSQGFRKQNLEETRSYEGSKNVMKDRISKIEK